MKDYKDKSIDMLIAEIERLEVIEKNTQLSIMVKQNELINLKSAEEWIREQWGEAWLRNQWEASDVISSMEEYASANQRVSVSDTIVYAALFNPCIHESSAGIISLHFTRKDAEMALEYSKSEHIKEHGELSDWEVYSIIEYKVTKK